MKILVLTNLYPPHYVGGYELHCEVMVKALRKRGHTIEVLTSNHGVEGLEAPAEPGIHRLLKIHGLFGHGWLGIQKLCAQERHNNDCLVARLQTFRPDLVYVWSCSGLSKSLLLMLQRQRIPRVFAVCDHWIARSAEADVWLRWWNVREGGMSRRLLHALWTYSGYRSKCHQHAPTNPVRHLRFPRLHFCSAALRDFTVAAGYKVEHGAVIYCPLDAEKYHPRPRSPSAPMKKLLYAGRLNADKGIHTALRAMALLGNNFTGSLSVYGRGVTDFEIGLKNFTREKNLPVTFHSPVIPAQMPAVYAAHDALLFTSEWPEPFALIPLEAMASRLPVIGTTTGGSAEIFRHGHNALTYKAGNAEELAQRILELSGNSALRDCITTNALHEVRERFREETIVDEVEIYLSESLLLSTAPTKNRVLV